MDQLSAALLSVVITALATYFGGNLFFDSSLPIAATLKAGLVTWHVRFMFFFIFGIAIYCSAPRNRVDHALADTLSSDRTRATLTSDVWWRGFDSVSRAALMTQPLGTDDVVITNDIGVRPHEHQQPI